MLQHLKFNWLVNLLDGGFFGFALGFASFVTIIPLFVSTLTDSPILIGLVPTIHSVGWQLPQLFTATKLQRSTYVKPLTIKMSVHERIPFLGLAVVAWFSPHLDTTIALVLVFLLLIWQGLGGGLTANPWQNLIGKVFPADQRGSFFGLQSSLFSLLAAVGAILAGIILTRFISPADYSLNFLITGLLMMVSLVFLAMTREMPSEIPTQSGQPESLLEKMSVILKKDANFRWYMIVRALSQFAVMASAFFTVFAVNYHAVSELEVGVMTGLLLGIQIIANPILGWLGDHWSHKRVMEIGILMAAASALIAWQAPSPQWFYLVFILMGISNVATWTISLTMVLHFGEPADRPTYVGMANTLVAPFVIMVPFLAGWLAEGFGYEAMFIISALIGLLTTLIIHVFLKDQYTIKSVVEET
jgi:MFS family permease